MTAVTNNRRRPWPRSPMTADAHGRGHQKKKKNKNKNKKIKKKKNKKKKKKKKRTAVMTAVTNNRRRPWPRTPMTAVTGKKK